MPMWSSPRSGSWATGHTGSVKWCRRRPTKVRWRMPTRPSQLVRLGLLLSGRGSNLQAIIDAIEAGTLSAEIAVVVSNKQDAGGLERARKHGVPHVWLDAKP